MRVFCSMYCVNFFRQVIGVIEVLMNQRNKDFFSKYWHFLLIFDHIAFVQCNNDIFCFDVWGVVTFCGIGRRGWVSDIFRFSGVIWFLLGGLEKKKWKIFFFFGCYATYVQELFFKLLLDDFCLKCELDIGRASSSFFQSFFLFWYTYIGLLYIYTGNTYILYRNSM